jgi:hypothetical protein
MKEFAISGVGKFESLWRHYKINNLAVLSKIYGCLEKHRGNILLLTSLLKRAFLTAKLFILSSKLSSSTLYYPI